MYIIICIRLLCDWSFRVIIMILLIIIIISPNLFFYYFIVIIVLLSFIVYYIFSGLSLFVGKCRCFVPSLSPEPDIIVTNSSGRETSSEIHARLSMFET